jgi:hypothetical protein
MKKPSVTRTYGPIHFEDLEPHRFEDLVRQLIYDYKDWQTIEATGRGGSDDGFDIRAFERVTTYDKDILTDEDVSEEINLAHPMDGNLWMIQCKREKAIGPQKVSQIINETVNIDSPPYGYMLVASTDFSKKSYDVFREELGKAGVMEFYLWGKAELEDMLHMPKYDRILFTFFGISLVSKKRSKVSEIRSLVTIKNKLYKVLGEENHGRQEVLIRDINDIYYPREKDCPNFNQNPKWSKYFFKGNHVYGIWIQMRMHYGYYDRRTKEWDMFERFDSSRMYDEHETEEERQEKMNKNLKIRNFWIRLPMSKQVEISVWGLLQYDQISLVDDKGDPLNKMPHIFADYRFELGPFSRQLHIIGEGHNAIYLAHEKASRVKIFPEILPDYKRGKIYKNKLIQLSDDVAKLKGNDSGRFSIYDQEENYKFLKTEDVINIKIGEKSDGSTPVKLTSKYSILVKDYYAENNDDYHIRQQVIGQLKKQPGDDELINVYEFIWYYENDKV